MCGNDSSMPNESRSKVVIRNCFTTFMILTIGLRAWNGFNRSFETSDKLKLCRILRREVLIFDELEEKFLRDMMKVKMGCQI